MTRAPPPPADAAAAAAAAADADATDAAAAAAATAAAVAAVRPPPSPPRLPPPAPPLPHTATAAYPSPYPSPERSTTPQPSDAAQMCTLRTQQRRLDEARAHCATSEALDPDFCDVHKSKGFLAIGRDDVGGAIAAFNDSLACVYTNVHAYKVLLTLYDALHQRDPHNGTLYEQVR